MITKDIAFTKLKHNKPAFLALLCALSLNLGLSSLVNINQQCKTCSWLLCTQFGILFWIKSCKTGDKASKLTFKDISSLTIEELDK